MKFLILMFLSFNLAFAEVPKDSVYNLTSKWTDHNNQSTSVNKLIGEKYKVVTMIFTSCPAACPLMLKHIKTLDDALTDKQKSHVEYVLFSIDPNDTVDQLKEFHKKFALDERFKFLKTTDEDDIQEVAAVLGFKYKKIDTSMYSHGTDVYLLNQKGQIIDKVGQSYKAKDLALKIP